MGVLGRGAVAGTILLAACGGGPLLLSPGPGPAPVCPAERCTGKTTPSRGEATTCTADAGTLCGDLSPSECVERALGAWPRAADDRQLTCVGARLAEGCRLGDTRACVFAGRMLLEGHGAAKDVAKGLELLAKACDDDFAEACGAGAGWLSQPEHARAADRGPALKDRFEAESSCLAGQGDECSRVGAGFLSGQGPYPQKPELAVRSYERGCAFGSSHACSNLADALEHGQGAPADLRRAAVVYQRSCDLGEALGCAALGNMLERGRGASRDIPRAKALYTMSCSAGDAYGCFHSEMMTTSHPEDPARALVGWQRACDRSDGRACAFVGILYEDGIDGTRDEAKSQEAMNRACELGNRRACDWSSHAQ